MPHTTPARAERRPEDYFTLELELFSVSDLTDALGIPLAAKLLGTSCRSLYTVRNTNEMGPERLGKLQAAVRKDEKTARARLVQLRNMQQLRRASRG